MNLNIRLLYEDGDLCVAEKPAGLLIAADGKGSPDLTTFLAQREKETSPVAITRLDRGVGGVAVFAKHKEAAAFLSRAVQDFSLFQKEYFAVVHGAPEAERGVLTDLLYHDPGRNKTFPVGRMRKGVKSASLEYTVLAKTEGEALVRVRLHTGRTHQIRAQFAARKMPLLGDGKYGSKENRCEVALFACRVSFPHPRGKRLDLRAEVPQGYPWCLFPAEAYTYGEENPAGE